MVNLRKEIREKIFTYLTAAFGLVAGLAWNDAVKALIEYLFPVNQDSGLAKLIYAVLVTVILVLVTVYLLKFLRKEETGKK